MCIVLIGVLWGPEKLAGLGEFEPSLSREMTLSDELCCLYVVLPCLLSITLLNSYFHYYGCGFGVLQVVGEALRDCISLEPCEWLVARALDALYDVFGADECPLQLFSSLQIMPVLENTAAQFSTKVIHAASTICCVYFPCCCLLLLSPLLAAVHNVKLCVSDYSFPATL